MTTSAAFSGHERDPFRVRQKACEPHWTISQKAVLSGILDELDGGRPGVFFRGGSGTGKTTVLQAVFDAVENRTGFQPALVSNPSGDGTSLLLWLLTAFGATAQDTSGLAPFERLMLVLQRLRTATRRPLLLIDEAQTIADAGLEALGHLVTEARESGYPLQVVMAGTGDLKGRLSKAGAGLSELSDAGALTPMTEQETKDFVLQIIEAAGRSPTEIFDPAALSTIHRETGGIPRLAESLCNECLFLASRNRTARIDADVVKQILARDELWQIPGVAQSSGAGHSAREEPSLSREHVSVAHNGVPTQSGEGDRARQPKDRGTVGFLAGAIAATGLLAGGAIMVPAVQTLLNGPHHQIGGASHPSERQNIELQATDAKTNPQITKTDADTRISAGVGLPLKDAQRPPARPVGVVPQAQPGETVSTVPTAGTAETALSVLGNESVVIDAAPPDPSSARRHFRNALSQTSPRHAVIEFSRAAAAGHGRAAYYLAQMFETGDGVLFAPATAQSWYVFSAAHGGQDTRPQPKDDIAIPELKPVATPLFSEVSDGILSLVWMGRGAFRVELAQRPGEPLAHHATDLTSLRVAPPAGLTWWRVIPEGGAPSAWLEIGTPDMAAQNN